MERKKKLLLIQSFLLITGILVIFFSYTDRRGIKEEKIISKEMQEKVSKQFNAQTENDNSDVFYNIEYSGLDLEGNRYILKAEQALKNKSNEEIIILYDVETRFYFKDGTILKVFSDEGIYNNKTLDMNFSKNVKGIYEESEILAQKAEFSNSKSYLKVSDNVKVTDIRGAMTADELIFDIKKKTLNIASFSDNKINANINLKWKKVLEF